MTTTSSRHYSGKPREERDAARRERLLAAAKTTFGAEGYAAAKIDRICASAQVSTRNFYDHFENKEAIFLAVYDEITAGALQAALASLAETEGQPIADRVPAGVSAYIRPLIADRATTRIAVVEIVGASAELERRRLDFGELLVQMITHEGTAAVANGEIEPRDFRVVALALAGAFNALLDDWSRGGLHDSSVSELEDRLTDIVLALVVAPVPRR